ncbi:MAG: cold shock domain-containing protein [Bacteroidota bacterium]
MKDIETSTEYFVHSSGLEQKIKDGDEVLFELQEGKKGINAVKVKLAE